MVWITVYRYGSLLKVDDGWLNIGVRLIHCVIPEWVCDTHWVFYSPSYFSGWKWDLRRLFHTHSYIPSDTVLKLSSFHMYWLLYQIFKAIVEASYELFWCSRFNCFARVLLHCYACVWSNCFARIWFNCFVHIYTCICLIFVVRFFLTTFFFLLWSYTITIDGSVLNSFEICSVLFWICCTLILTTINISLYVSVCWT